MYVHTLAAGGRGCGLRGVVKSRYHAHVFNYVSRRASTLYYCASSMQFICSRSTELSINMIAVYKRCVQKQL